MLVTIEISKDAYDELAPAVAETIAGLAEKEARRLWHCRRSQPKSKGTPSLREAQKLGERLLAIYAKKRERYSHTLFPPAFILEEELIRGAMEEGDVDALKLAMKEQKWQLRK